MRAAKPPNPGRTKRMSAARAWAHDLVCMSDACAGDNDHARRTQHGFARHFVDAPTDADALDTLHRLLCLPAARGDCPYAGPHTAALAHHTLPAVREIIEEAVR